MLGAMALQLLATAAWRARLLATQAQRDALGLGGPEIRVTPWTTVVYPLLSLFAGVCRTRATHNKPARWKAGKMDLCDIIS